MDLVLDRHQARVQQYARYHHGQWLNMRRCLFLGEAPSGASMSIQNNSAAEQLVAGERGIAPFATGFVRRGLNVTARAT
jgi:hypothetical protein